MTRLQSHHVSLTYPAAAGYVVEDLSLSVPDDLITTIIGPNGCGKSTLLRALSRLLRPERGSVVLDGELIHRLPTKEVARRLGLLHQQPAAPEGISVEDLVRRGRYPHQGFMQPPTKRDLLAVDQALDLAGMTELRHRHVDSLSGGQRQRAWIAMAVAQETDLLLLDEPTTFLDIAHRIEVMDLVQHLNTSGKTVMMVLHDINEAAKTSHRLVAMKDGRIVREGAPRDIVEPELLGCLYGVSCDVFAHPVDGQPFCLPVSEDADYGVRPGLAKPGIEIRGLTTGYGKSLPVSRNVTATLPAGVITAIVGSNACGKSTLLRTGARLLKAHGGAFLVDGKDARSGSRRSLARRMAMVMQAPLPPPGFVVEDMVAAGRLPHQAFHRQWSRQDAQMVGSALERCRLADFRYREIETLSGGQRQRAWIALALAQDTPFLFLDEPTSFLDIGSQIEVLDLVRRLNRAEERTVVMVLHDLNLAARYADHVMAMKNGAIVASGPPSEVINEDMVLDVFGVAGHLTTDTRTGRPLVLAR